MRAARRIAAAVAGAVLVAGCQIGTGPTTADDGVTELHQARVLDGDTFDATDAGGQPVRVRLIGVDAPEIRHGAVAAQCGAVEAQRVLRRLLAAVTSLRLVPDARSAPVDRYGRRLGYVQLGTDDVGLLLIRAGVVEAWTPHGAAAPTRMSEYLAAQRRAQNAGAGSWRTCGRLGR